MKELILISSTLFLFGCRTQTLIGLYQSSDGIINLKLNTDSTFSKSALFCVGSSNEEGRWYSKGNLLIIIPSVPNDIYYDSINKKYQYKKTENFVLPTGEVIKVPKYIADINTNFSKQIFKINRGRLYLQYINKKNVIKYVNCPYFKAPKSYFKAKRLQRKYEKRCS